MTDEWHPTPEMVLAVHDEIADEYDLQFTDTRGAAPIVRLRGILEDTAKQDDLWHRAAFLLRTLITAHIFEDGNKRTAWATTEIYLERNDASPAERGESVEDVLLRIRRYDVDELAEWLETGKLDRSRLDP